MSLYTLDENAGMGHAGIGDAHRRIAELSTELIELVNGDAEFETVFGVFELLKETLIAHFDLEERLFATLPKTPDVERHIQAHMEDHNLFRDLFTYADGQFHAKRKLGEIPNVAALLPDKYFLELKKLDAELAQLLKAQSRSP